MSELNNCDFLYHYTSIDVLALILKNRTIRLNPLDKLDDLQEQITADVKELGRFVFVSSWTDDEEESIPMWKMYTNPLSGVRIKLRKNPFIRHGTSAKDFADKMGLTVVEPANSKVVIDTFLNLADVMNKGFYTDQAWSGDILKQVIYTNELELLEPKVLETIEDNFILTLGKLGLHKSIYWRFQKEWRYIMRFVPLSFSSDLNRAADEFNVTLNKMVLGIQAPPFPYFDLNITPDAFAEMEITCSPRITPGNKIIMDTLVEKYNPSAIVRDSVLVGKL